MYTVPRYICGFFCLVHLAEHILFPEHLCSHLVFSRVWGASCCSDLSTWCCRAQALWLIPGRHPATACGAAGWSGHLYSVSMSSYWPSQPATQWSPGGTTGPLLGRAYPASSPCHGTSTEQEQSIRWLPEPQAPASGRMLLLTNGAL